MDVVGVERRRGPPAAAPQIDDKPWLRFGSQDA